MHWGDDADYYRPVQTPDLEQRVGEQIDELWQAPTVGENVGTPDSVDDGDSSVSSVYSTSVATPVDTTPLRQSSPPSQTYAPPVQTYTPPKSSSCHGVCARAAY
jgi:hypothetical protein